MAEEVKEVAKEVVVLAGVLAGVVTEAVELEAEVLFYHRLLFLYLQRPLQLLLEVVEAHLLLTLFNLQEMLTKVVTE